MLHPGFMNFRRRLFLLVVVIVNLTRAFSNLVDETSWNGCNHTRNNELVCDGFIPHDVPSGTEVVRLINVDSKHYSNATLLEGRFLTGNWGRVIQLGILDDREWTPTIPKFDSFCFRGLNYLKKLQISFTSYFEFTENTFETLDNVTMLDLSGCRRFPVSKLISAIRGRHILPALRALHFSTLNSYWNGIDLDNDFFEVIRDKKIEKLDMSLTQINFVNLTSFLNNCDYLIYINVSKVVISDADYNTLYGNYRTCTKLKYIDISYTTVPTMFFQSQLHSTVFIRNTYFPLLLNWVYMWNSVEYLDISGFMPAAQNTYVFDNVTVLVLNGWQLKTIIIRYLNLERLDLNVLWPNWTIEHIDASNCQCGYISPSFFSSANGLKVINLSNNLLYKMLKENGFLFEKLFEKLHEIKVINISGNQLETLPGNMFTSNKNLETLDLSRNSLKQITFDLNTHATLKNLDLRANFFSIPNSLSVAKLKAWLTDKSFSSKVDFRDNSLVCSTCESLSYVEWMSKSKYSINMISETMCINGENKAVAIDESTRNDIKVICNRPNVILGTCISSALLILIIILLVFARRRYLRDKQYRLNMEERIQLIREGAENHEFVVFLSYSSKDDDFVHTYVKQPLQENLQRVIGEDRELVCEGDRYFRYGRPIPDEMSCLLKRASVVVVVLSDNYCNSVHCRNEFDQAFLLEKPVILMVKGHVSVEQMTPLISDIYNKRTRIHWHKEDGVYVLHSSWENVCTSVIELVT